MTTRPVLANAGAMKEFVGAFAVTSKLTGHAYQCRFSYMWNGIATRHSDTIDTKFFVDGDVVMVGLGAYRLRKIPRAQWPRFDGSRGQLSSPPIICESASRKKTFARFTMSPTTMSCV